MANHHQEEFDPLDLWLRCQDGDASTEERQQLDAWRSATPEAAQRIMRWQRAARWLELWSTHTPAIHADELVAEVTARLEQEEDSAPEEDDQQDEVSEQDAAVLADADETTSVESGVDALLEQWSAQTPTVDLDSFIARVNARIDGTEETLPAEFIAPSAGVPVAEEEERESFAAATPAVDKSAVSTTEGPQPHLRVVGAGTGEPRRATSRPVRGRWMYRLGLPLAAAAALTLALVGYFREMAQVQSVAVVSVIQLNDPTVQVAASPEPVVKMSFVVEPPPGYEGGAQSSRVGFGSASAGSPRRAATAVEIPF
jgi:hypothetical protein